MSDKSLDLVLCTREQAEEWADDLCQDFGDKFFADRLQDAKIRKDFAMVAANIAEDRYSAGSSAARAVLVALLRGGVQAAKDFIADMEHHES